MMRKMLEWSVGGMLERVEPFAPDWVIFLIFLLGVVLQYLLIVGIILLAACIPTFLFVEPVAYRSSVGAVGVGMFVWYFVFD